MSNYQLFHNDLPSKVLNSFKGDISIDTETLGLNIKRDRLCLIQLRNETDKKVYLIKFEEDLSPKLSKNLKTLLENKDLTKIFHFGRFDMAVLKENLKRAGIKGVKIKKRGGVGEVIAPHYEVMVKDETIVMIYEPLACHSYNQIK